MYLGREDHRSSTDEQTTTSAAQKKAGTKSRKHKEKQPTNEEGVELSAPWSTWKGMGYMQKKVPY